LSLKQMVICAMIAGLLCIIAPLSIPVGSMPLSLINVIVFVCIFVWGKNNTLIGYIIYLLIGFLGLPVFAGFKAGFSALFGITGGFLIGFIPLISISGFFVEKYNKKIIIICAMIISEIILYMFGVVWFLIITNISIIEAIIICVLPFVFVDFIKILIAYYLGMIIKKRIDSAIK